MRRKLAAIAGNELRLRVHDPVAWLLALAVPLLVAALISLAFGDLVLGQTMPEARIAVGIVNSDRGGAWGRLGEIFVRIFLSDDASVLPAALRFPLFAPRLVPTEMEARRAVERGRLSAALIIPSDFSQALAEERATVRVWVSGQEPALGQAFAAAVRAVAQTISLGEVTIRTTANGLLGQSRLRALLTSGALDNALTELALAAIQPEANPIQIRRLPPPEQPAQIRLTHYLAATITLTMLGLTSLLTSAAIFQERAQWTLQRTLMTPTPPWALLWGKTLGALATSLVQVMALIGGLALMERWLHGASASAPVPDPTGLGLLVGAAVLATTGYGALVAGLTRSLAESLYLGGALLIILGLLGGVFFPAELLPQALQALARGTHTFWAMDGYLRLARGEGVAAIWPNLGALLAFGTITAALGYRLLLRRIEAV